jgi:hypothetical protein
MVRMRTVVEDEIRKFVSPTCPFSAASLNIDPTSCNWHRDSSNLAYGLCAVLVFGCFNYQRNGHLLFYESRTIVELQAGDFIFFPSASITHRNSPLLSGDTRMSLSVYTAADLFRQREEQQCVKAEKNSKTCNYDRWTWGWETFFKPSDCSQ